LEPDGGLNFRVGDHYELTGKLKKAPERLEYLRTPEGEPIPLGSTPED